MVNDDLCGYTGRVLRVDLSRGITSIDDLGQHFLRKYIGGRGFISYFTLKEIPAQAEPLGEDNKLIFATGPITGVPIPGAGRNSVGAKSPLTNGYGDSEVGGYWGAELKHAGYDAIIIQGASADPVYLWVTAKKAEIREAGHLWGKATAESQKLIQEELGDDKIRTAQIGLAGENLVRYACIINDLSHAAGRTGMGAVMGSKKLKAIAVRGRQKVKLSNPAMVNSLARWLRDNFMKQMPTSIFRELGTSAALFGANLKGGLPTRNFREGVFGGASKISDEELQKYVVRMGGCYACPVRCKNKVALKEPYSVDPNYGGPEYETLAALGSNCGIDDIKVIVKANELCSAYGLDTISTGDNIAFAMECFERGILNERNSGGISIEFGNGEALLKLVEMIGRRVGIGELLAEGVARAAKAIGKGAEQLAMHVKGLELPMHEPRHKQGAALGFVVSPTGADHNHNIEDTLFDRWPFINKFGLPGIFEPLPCSDLSPRKVRMLFYGSLWRHVLDCLVFCNFVQLNPKQIAELVSATSGWDVTVWELMKVAERCINVTRLFNFREGFSKDDDRLPNRFFTPLVSKPLKNPYIEKGQFQEALQTYYAMVGWDAKGAPTLAKLQELGIENDLAY
jgi:aldehyde:ferredoxin oxidoreductase